MWSFDASGAYCFGPDFELPEEPAKPVKTGVNDSRRIECKASKHHGFYPADEECPYCPPRRG